MSNTSRGHIPFAEFVTLMAIMTSLVALTIDAMLPALPDMGRELGARDPNDVQLIVSVIFIGLAVGQLFYGPLSDSIGRKPAANIGIILFMLGCVCSLLATDFDTMLLGRLLQGLGLGAPRVITIALIRDEYQGREMARVMSFIMSVFILVPMVAPALGQGILLIADWRAIFTVFLAVGLLVLVWFNWRQPETLSSSKRRPFSVGLIFRAAHEVLTNPISVAYTLMAGLCSGAFIAYLSTSQQILAGQYGLAELFPLIFALLALAIGSASYVNARLVMKCGMQTLMRRSSRVMIVVGGCYGLYALYTAGHPPLWTLLVYFTITLFCTGLMFGNMNAAAMEPLGHIAGVGASIVGSVSTIISVPVAIGIGRVYDNSVTPLVMGFLLTSLLAMLLLAWAESRRVE
ncbi:multidrug effflux MFS transporter [Pseudomaricurvus alkylphenolicus]|uniref:multidrug effflux MFS transporter n=1 Tax=Pseudomaricurvus alkylphenolicus TaxID=1306991 RepID=UPI00141D8507|nr:multidrug effflux MFS transporter [Pseudomaricurvus alkylphenolicus]NIB40800.1 multidrug effflux MFS transporter [Pseudomaricurvus alkylphenolicus]